MKNFMIFRRMAHVMILFVALAGCSFTVSFAMEKLVTDQKLQQANEQKLQQIQEQKLQQTNEQKWAEAQRKLDTEPAQKRSKLGVGFFDEPETTSTTQKKPVWDFGDSTKAEPIKPTQSNAPKEAHQALSTEEVLERIKGQAPSVAAGILDRLQENGLVSRGTVNSLKGMLPAEKPGMKPLSLDDIKQMVADHGPAFADRAIDAAEKAKLLTSDQAKAVRGQAQGLGLIPPKEKKGLTADSFKGDTALKYGGATLTGIGALGGLGGIGAGVAVGETGQDKTGKELQDIEDAIVGKTPVDGTTGQLVVSGITLDFSKLTIPTLQPLIDNGSLKAVMYASKPISNLANQLLKAVTTSVVIKTQDSFNVAIAAMKSPKSEFNDDGTIEQITAKTLQDCKDIKSFAVNFVDLVGETKRKTVTLDGVKKTVGMIIDQVKKNFETLFTVDIVAQLTVAQQKVAKADLVSFMKRVNKMVQLVLDDATNEVAKNIKDRMVKASGSTTASKQTDTTIDTDADQPVTKVVKVKTASTAPADEDSVAVGWDALVNQ